MNIRALRTLAAIETNGSFTETAARLHMTVSAVSMQMKMLEQELRVALFDRSFRPPQLTPIGKAVAMQAKILLQANDALLDVCQSAGALSGEFNLGFVPTSSVRLLPEFLRRAVEAHPAAHFRIATGVSEELVKMVSGGALDAAVVTHTDDMPANIHADTLLEEELVLCLPPSHADWTMEDCLAKMTFIHFLPASGIGRLIAQYFTRVDRRAIKSLILDSVEAVSECVMKGIGFSILPEPDIRRHARRDQIVLRSLEPLPLTRRLVLVSIAGGRMKTHVKVLVNLLTQSKTSGPSRLGGGS